MNIRTSSFGSTASGREITCFTLENENGLRAELIDYGALWTAMYVPDKKGELDDVVLGFETVADYENKNPHFGAPVGRFANRIGGASFSLGDKTYFLHATVGDVCLHSGKNFWGERIWEYRILEGEGVAFFLQSPHMDQGFPGNLTVCIEYRLTREDMFRIDYRIKTDADTVCNVTNHAYFNLSGHRKLTLQGQEVRIDAGFFTPTDEFFVPTGEVRPVENTPMDLRSFRSVEEGLASDYPPILEAGGYDHNWVLDGFKRDENGSLYFRRVAAVRDPDSKRQMEVYTDLPGMQFYTGNSIRVREGKHNKTYGPRSGYCFETQFFPNSVNIPSFVQPVIKAGETFASSTGYRFLVEK